MAERKAARLAHALLCRWGWHARTFTATYTNGVWLKVCAYCGKCIKSGIGKERHTTKSKLRRLRRKWMAHK